MAGPIFETAISLPFVITSQGNIGSSRDQKKIWSDRVKAALGTATGERLFYSYYGTDLLDAQFGTVDAMKKTLTANLESMFLAAFPTLVLTNIDLVHDEFSNVLTATVEYTLPNQEEVVTSLGIVTTNGDLPVYEENR
jgi:hypothetical protein